MNAGWPLYHTHTIATRSFLVAEQRHNDIEKRSQLNIPIITTVKAEYLSQGN